MRRHKARNFDKQFLQCVYVDTLAPISLQEGVTLYFLDHLGCVILGDGKDPEGNVL